MGKNYRRIEQLKAIAFDCGFGNEDAKLFGKLSKTATWEGNARNLRRSLSCRQQ
jgi:hypothetical protein